ncbi:unnamed protein product, partial [Closterium sp. NIES-53]
YLNEPSTGYVGGFDPADLEQLFRGMRENYTAWASGFALLMVGRDISSPEVRQLTESVLLVLVRPDIALSALRTTFQSDYFTDMCWDRYHAP